MAHYSIGEFAKKLDFLFPHFDTMSKKIDLLTQRRKIIVDTMMTLI